MWQNDPAIGQFIQQLPGSKSPLTVAIGEKRDARCLVQINKDRMSATLTLVPPEGGLNLTLDQVRTALASKGARVGLLEDVLSAPT